MEVSAILSRLQLIRGDITKVDAEAIVNAANSKLGNGGGVARAIRLAAGEQFQAECDELGAKRGCPTGQAAITGAGRLPYQAVVHAVGPIWAFDPTSEPTPEAVQEKVEQLRSAYNSAIELAAEHGINHLAFPSISTGIYQFPLDLAAITAASEIARGLIRHPQLRVTMCLFSADDLEAYRAALGSAEWQQRVEAELKSSRRDP